MKHFLFLADLFLGPLIISGLNQKRVRVRGRVIFERQKKRKIYCENKTNLGSLFVGWPKKPNNVVRQHSTKLNSSKLLNKVAHFWCLFWLFGCLLENYDLPLGHRFGHLASEPLGAALALRPAQRGHVPHCLSPPPPPRRIQSNDASLSGAKPPEEGAERPKWKSGGWGAHRERGLGGRYATPTLRHLAVSDNQPEEAILAIRCGQVAGGRESVIQIMSQGGAIKALKKRVAINVFLKS